LNNIVRIEQHPNRERIFMGDFPFVFQQLGLYRESDEESGEELEQEDCTITSIPLEHSESFSDAEDLINNYR
jgi:hypothetical protein